MNEFFTLHFYRAYKGSLRGEKKAQSIPGNGFLCNRWQRKKKKWAGKEAYVFQTYFGIGDTDYKRDNRNRQTERGDTRVPSAQIFFFHT